MKKLFLAVSISFFFAHVGLSNTVISDPSGNPVVVQIGNEYQWNDTLDGVTLWGVVDEQDGPPQVGTTTFENSLMLFKRVSRK